MNPSANMMIMSVILFTVTDVSAQICPPSIEVVSSARAMPLGWNAVPVSSVHTLSGMSVISGKINYEDESENAILRPLDEPNGGYFWRFNEPAGNEELWVRCNYHETPVQFDFRIAASTKECRVSKSISTKPDGKLIVSTICK